MDRYAEEVRSGDEFLVEKSNELVPATVQSISTIQMKGGIELLASFTNETY